MNQLNLPKNIFGFIVDTEQGKFCIDARDEFVGKSLQFNLSYGLNEIKSISSLINSETRLLVVGAHIGALLIPLAKIVKNAVGIEANPSTYKLLQCNVVLNECTNVRTFNTAASDENGSITFVCNTVNSGGSKRYPKIWDEAYFYDSPATIEVQSSRLDDYLLNEQFDFVLMDIEGSEYFALKGMSRIIKNCKILVMEFIPHHLKNVAMVSVDEILQPLSEFESMYIPSKSIWVHRESFLDVLSEMCERNMHDDGIFFFKQRVTI